MNHAKLLFSIAFVVGAQAIVDPKAIPNLENPTEMLAYGLITHDAKLIEQALDSGADPYKVHKCMQSSEQLSDLSPYHLLTYKLKRELKKDRPPRFPYHGITEEQLPVLNTFEACATLMITKGVSVDIGNYTGRSTFRAALCNSNDPCSFGFFGTYVVKEQEIHAHATAAGQRILQLVEKHQPRELWQLRDQAIYEAREYAKDKATSNSREDNLDVLGEEAPLDPQRKLLWGLTRLHRDAVAEALNSGASPFQCLFFPGEAGTNLEASPYGILFWSGITPFLKPGYPGNDDAIMPTPAEAEALFHKLYDVCELLLQHKIPLMRGYWSLLSAIKMPETGAVLLNALHGPAMQVEFLASYASLIRQWEPKFISLIAKHQPAFMALIQGMVQHDPRFASERFTELFTGL